MKRVLLTAVTTVGLTLIPAVGAHALSFPSTDISASQNQSNDLSAAKSNSSSSNNMLFFNQTVNYEAISMVKYSATTTSFSQNSQNNTSNAAVTDNAMNNTQSEFSTPAAILSQFGN